MLNLFCGACTLRSMKRYELLLAVNPVGVFLSRMQFFRFFFHVHNLNDLPKCFYLANQILQNTCMALEEKYVFVQMRGSRKLPILFASATVTNFGEDPLVFQ